MAYSEDQVMLTLSGLAYRGFQDVLPGEPHDHVVRRALLEGLDTLGPVRGEWELVWGPVTGRVPVGVFDSSAMYVVRSRREPQRHVVAIRGTNPVSSSDWLFGDLWVGTTVAWPWADDDAAISTSTAVGLATLQAMRSRPPSVVSRLADAVHEHLGAAVDRIIAAGRANVSGMAEARATRGSSVEAQIETIVGHWVMKRAERADVLTQLRKAESRVRLDAVMLRRPWQPAEHREELELLTFLRTQAESSAVPLDVVVTGHSKGGALAPTVALWLAETRDPQAVPPTQCWDPSGRAKVRCYAFAGPTPGNAAFATRVERKLDQGHHRIVNTNDVVTHAWDTGGPHGATSTTPTRRPAWSRLPVSSTRAIVCFRPSSSISTWTPTWNASR